MDWWWAGLWLFREPSPSLCGGWTWHWERHEDKTEDVEANEGTSLADRSSQWCRVYLQAAAHNPSFSPMPAAHITCHATVPDLGLRSAARPPTDRPCLSQSFLRTRQMRTLPWKKDESCVILPSLKTGQIPEHTVSSQWILAPHWDNNCRVYLMSPRYLWQCSKSGWWLIKVLDSHWSKFFSLVLVGITTSVYSNLFLTRTLFYLLCLFLNCMHIYLFHLFSSKLHLHRVITLLRHRQEIWIKLRMSPCFISNRHDSFHHSCFCHMIEVGS